jgi:hypothetical protein
MSNANSLFASLFWGSIGIGFTVYGKRQGAPAALAGGVAIVACSYFIGSALFLSLASLGLGALAIWLTKRGF